MMKHLLTALVPIALAGAPLAVSLAAEGTEEAAKKLVADRGSVTEAEGLQAWTRIEAVVTHPRCANCHPDDSNVPMWSGPNYGDTPRPHGMNINGGVSRIGAETLICSTCHTTSTRPNPDERTAPHAGIPWQLAPVEFVWFGRSGPDICRQMRDSQWNGGRDAVGVVEHLLHDEELDGFIQWAWKPGGGRETPPGTYEDHLRDTTTWAAAGMPCPE